MSSVTGDRVREQLDEALLVHRDLASDTSLAEQLARWASRCVSAIRAGGTIFFAGNGGSFADAQHLAAELTGKMGRVRDALPGVALGTNSSSMTAIGNDFGYDHVFARELRALAKANSLVVALSTSGNSANILELASAAGEMGVPALGLTGQDGGALRDLCEVIRVPSRRTERVQEMHILLGHTLCLLVEDELSFAGGDEHLP